MSEFLFVGAFILMFVRLREHMLGTSVVVKMVSSAVERGVFIVKTLLKCESVSRVQQIYRHCFATVYVSGDGPGSSVGIVTGYGLDGPGIESRCGRDFPHLSRPALGPTQPSVQWVPGLSPCVKSGRGVTLTPHPLLVPWSIKSSAIPLLPQWSVRPEQSLSACARVHFTFMFLDEILQ